MSKGFVPKRLRIAWCDSAADTGEASKKLENNGNIILDIFAAEGKRGWFIKYCKGFYTADEIAIMGVE
jgi:hypothetical protein